MSTLLTSHYLTAMDARRLSKLATEAAMSVNGLQLEDDLDAQKEPPSYRDIMPRRAWLPPGAAASSTPASPVGGPPLSPTSPRSPYAVLCPLSPPLPSDTTPPPPPLTPAVRPPPVPPPATPKRASFASLRLVGKDGIRVSGFPTTLFETIETTLQKGWRGVRERRAAGEAFEWTLDGAPSFASHRLIEFILFALSKAGWQVTAAPTLPGQQRDSFIFRSCTPRERVFFTVLFERLSILLLDPPPEVREAWRQVLDSFPAAPATEQQPRVLRTVMTGRTDDPWVNKPDMTSELVCALLAKLEATGYEVVAVFDAIGTQQQRNPKLPAALGADAWVFASK